MNAAPPAPPAPSAWPSRWQRFAAASVRGFHAYANWLVGISWRRFLLLAVLLGVFVGGFYSFRLVFYAFHGKERFDDPHHPDVKELEAERAAAVKAEAAHASEIAAKIACRAAAHSVAPRMA